MSKTSTLEGSARISCSMVLTGVCTQNEPTVPRMTRVPVYLPSGALHVKVNLYPDTSDSVLFGLRGLLSLGVFRSGRSFAWACSASRVDAAPSLILRANF